MFCLQVNLVDFREKYSHALLNEFSFQVLLRRGKLMKLSCEPQTHMFYPTCTTTLNSFFILLVTLPHEI